MSRTLAAFIALTVLSCTRSDSESGDPWNLGGDAGSDVREDSGVFGGCERDSDCAEGFYCDGPTACGAERRCVEGYSPCSAAAPFEGCGCDGTVQWFAAGCPGPHAWPIGQLGFDVTGAPCDPGAGPIFDYSVTVVIADDPVFSEGTLYAKAHLAPELGVVEVDEARTVRFTASGDQWGDFGLDLLLDRDGDGRCTPEVDVDFATVDDGTTVDLETFEVVSSRYLQRVSTPCDRWP